MQAYKHFLLFIGFNKKHFLLFIGFNTLLCQYAEHISQAKRGKSSRWNKPKFQSEN